MKGSKKGTSLLIMWTRKVTSFLWLSDCAGGICLRERRGKKELLCVLHKSGKLMLPKGKRKKGEPLSQTALREFQEETGLQNSHLGHKIGTIRDRVRGRKITFYWAHKNTMEHSIMHDEAIMWVELDKAARNMKHTSEKKFLKKYIIK